MKALRRAERFDLMLQIMAKASLFSPNLVASGVSGICGRLARCDPLAEPLSCSPLWRLRGSVG
jgi:hypothetical protein